MPTRRTSGVNGSLVLTAETPTVVAPVPAGNSNALVNRAKSGDRVAFGQLIEDHYDFIFRTACKWTGKKSDAEDIAQEVCIKLASVIQSFDGRSKFTSWLYRVTINMVRDMPRSAGRRGRNVDAYSQVHPEDDPPTQEESTTAKELWKAVGGLPEKQREAVMLVYAEDMNHATA